jgi:hypothetical protein
MVDALVTEAVVCLPPSPHDLVLASVVTTQPLLSDALITVGLSFGGLGGAFRCFRVGGVRWRVGSDPGVFDLGLLLSWFVAGGVWGEGSGIGWSSLAGYSGDKP